MSDTPNLPSREEAAETLDIYNSVPYDPDDIDDCRAAALLEARADGVLLTREEAVIDLMVQRKVMEMFSAKCDGKGNEMEDSLTALGIPGGEVTVGPCPGGYVIPRLPCVEETVDE
jgi:hypothetical protein